MTTGQNSLVQKNFTSSDGSFRATAGILIQSGPDFLNLAHLKRKEKHLATDFRDLHIVMQAVTADL